LKLFTFLCGEYGLQRFNFGVVGGAVFDAYSETLKFGRFSMRIPLPVLLAIVSVGCLALGAYLGANPWEVVFGLVLGGGVSGGLLFLIRRMQQDQAPRD
jgi:hypothetical protein